METPWRRIYGIMANPSSIPIRLLSISIVAVVLAPSLPGCTTDDKAERIDERSLEGAVVTHCGMKTEIAEDGTGRQVPIAYYFDHMNNQLDRTPEMRAHVGLDRVSTCAEAEQFALAQPAWDAAHPIDESALLPKGELRPASEDTGFRVYYGEDVQKPGVVLITMEDGAGCSAVFITQRHILTSAHCFDGMGGDAQDIDIFEENGSSDYSTSNRVGFVHIHPNYTGNGSSTDINDDIALISLWDDLPWTPTPHRFYTGTTNTDYGLHIYGYGFNTHAGGGPGILREGADNTLINVNYHTDGYFRATGHTARTCVGDSGGPAIDHTYTVNPITWGVHSTSEKDGNQCTEYEGKMWWTKTNVKAAWIADLLLENEEGDFHCEQFTYGVNGSYYRCFW